MRIFDHAGGLAALKRATGATLVVSAGDRPDLMAGRTIGRPELGRFPPVTPDRVVRDGGTLQVGGTVLTATLTPGHTPGCTSWPRTTQERAARGSQGAGRPVTILFACSLTVAGQRLIADGRETPAVAAFRSTFAKLRRTRADVFLNFHPGFFDFDAKRARLAKGNMRAFINPGELPRQIDRAERAFEAELAQQRGRPQS